MSLRARLLHGWRFCLAVLFFLLAQIVAATLSGLLFDPKVSRIAFESVFRPLALIILGLLFVLLARFFEKSPEPALGTQGVPFHSGWRLDLAAGAALGFALISFCIAAVAVLGDYQREYHPTPGLASRLAAVVWIAVTAATLEEVAFRGYPFFTLAKAVGRWPAAFAMSLLFAAGHLLNPHWTAIGFANTAFVGFLLTMTVLRTGSLWIAIGIHLAWNLALGTFYGLPVSGVDLFTAGIRGAAVGHPLLTGGAYGLEASLTGTVAIVLGLAVVPLITRPKNSATPGTRAPF